MRLLLSTTLLVLAAITAPRTRRQPARPRHRRPRQRPHAADLRQRRPALRRRHARSSLRGAPEQPQRRARAGRAQRRRRQCGQRRNREPAADRLRARCGAVDRDRRLAQEPRRGGAVQLHRAARQLRRAHRPARQRRRDRGGGVHRAHAGLASLAVDRRRAGAAGASPRPAQRAESAGADSALARSQALAPDSERLGTGHGAREYAHVDTTAFERATRAPVETDALWYDSYAHLVAQGIIARPLARRLPQPFPGGFVPDPPRR